jgi:hypothetical protein
MNFQHYCQAGFLLSPFTGTNKRRIGKHQEGELSPGISLMWGQDAWSSENTMPRKRSGITPGTTTSIPSPTDPVPPKQDYSLRWTWK